MVILFAHALFISAEMGSTAHFIKNAVALIGPIVLFAGVYLRPVKAAPETK